jgi:hypothetical protein
MVTVYFDLLSIVIVECSKPVFAPRRGERAGGSVGRKSRFLPSYVRLPTVAEGRLVLPQFTVTSAVERRHGFSASPIWTG